MRIYDYTHAINSLRPGATWSITDNKYSSIVWMDTQQDKPTESEIQAEVQRLQSVWDAAEYRRLRTAAYPPVGDQLDALMKWLDTQEVTSELQGVIDWCKEVKAKYPKGGV